MQRLTYDLLRDVTFTSQKLMVDVGNECAMIIREFVSEWFSLEVYKG